MSGAVEGGSTGRAEAGPEQSQVRNDDASRYPEGLTEDGRAKYQELCEANAERFARQLRQEMTRHWVSLRLDGPEAHTWDRVLAADAARQDSERRKIVDEVRMELRAELVEELQSTSDQNIELTQKVNELKHTLAELLSNPDPGPAPERLSPARSKLRRAGHCIIAGTAALLAAWATPTVGSWETVGVVTASVIGTWLVPTREEH